MLNQYSKSIAVRIIIKANNKPTTNYNYLYTRIFFMMAVTLIKTDVNTLLSLVCFSIFRN